MLFPLTLAAATAPSDEPALREGLDPASVTPGTLGFLATLSVVIGVFFLIRDMTKRIRRVRYNEMVQESRLQATVDDDGGRSGNGLGDSSAKQSPNGRGDPSAGLLPEASGHPREHPQPIPGAPKHGTPSVPGGKATGDTQEPGVR